MALSEEGRLVRKDGKEEAKGRWTGVRVGQVRLPGAAEAGAKARHNPGGFGVPWLTESVIDRSRNGRTKEGLTLFPLK